MIGQVDRDAKTSRTSLTCRRSLLGDVPLADGFNGRNFARVKTMVAGANGVVVFLLIVGDRVRGPTTNPAGPISGSRFSVRNLSVRSFSQKSLVFGLQKLSCLKRCKSGVSNLLELVGELDLSLFTHELIFHFQVIREPD